MRLGTGHWTDSHPENPSARTRACATQWSLSANTSHFFNLQEFLFSSPALRSRALDFFSTFLRFLKTWPIFYCSYTIFLVFWHFPNNLFSTHLHSPWQKFPIITTYLDKATENLCGLFLHKELPSGRFPLLTLSLPVHPGRLSIQMVKSLPGVVRCMWGHEDEPGHIPFEAHFPWLCELL